MKNQNAEKKRDNTKKLKKDFSFQEYIDDPEDNDRNSIVEMFTYLEKRYKGKKKNKTDEDLEGSRDLMEFDEKGAEEIELA